jgi:N-acetylmuramoyl-L-alanine amidase
MKIGLRGGHSDNCQGANGLRNEYFQMQELYKHVRDLLVKYGHTVIDCNSHSNTEGKELAEGVNRANDNEVGLFVSLHMNSYNGSANGTETWIKSTNSKSYPIAKSISNNFGNLGFFKRDGGVKTSNGYYELNHTDCPAIIVETCFCDSQKDIDIWAPTSWDILASCVANGIDSNIPIGEATTKEPEKPIIGENDNVYIFTEYLPTGYMGNNNSDFKDLDVKYIDEYMCGIRWAVRKNSIGYYAVTELLDPITAKKVKESLGAWFYEYRLDNK